MCTASFPLQKSNFRGCLLGAPPALTLPGGAEELQSEMGLTAAGLCLGGAAGWIYSFKLCHGGNSSVLTL